MFKINNDYWSLQFVKSDSNKLKRSNGSYSVGVTDYNDKTIYLSDLLYGQFLKKVICHEIVHCVCFSMNIHLEMLQEEWLANFVSQYGEDIIYTTNELCERINKKIA